MNDMSLKSKINNIAKQKNIAPQAVLQNYLMRRFLLRLAKTEYKDKFVVKGGILISSIIGIDHRTTMDIDATLRNIPLTRTEIKKAFKSICDVELEDGISFVIDSIEPIRKDDEYGGFRISFYANYGKIKAPMSMDVSTGDVITPKAVKRMFADMFDGKERCRLWSYPIETILAEKIETILSRGIDNTRPRDFYDVYMLSADDYNPKLFKEAFIATSSHRGSYEKIKNCDEILNEIENDKTMNNRFISYTKLMPYAANITFKKTLEAVKNLASYIKD